MAEKSKTDWVTPVAIVGGGAALAVGAVMLFKKKPVPGKFDILQPIASSSSVGVGDVVKIDCGIAMVGGEAFTATVIVQIAEGSILPSAGDLIKQFSKKVKFAVGETQTISIDWTASGGINSKDVTVVITSGGATLDSHHFDDVFRVVQGTTAFSLGQPVVTPDPVAMGASTTIECPVTSRANQDKTVVIRMQVAESSWLPTPGTLLKEIKSSPFTIKSGETVTSKFTYAASGAVGSKDVSVFVEISGSVITSNHFDDAFHVVAGGSGGGGTGGGGGYFGTAFALGQPEATPDFAAIGEWVGITCPVTSESSSPLEVIVVMQVAESSWLPTPGTLLDQQQSEPFEISPGETMDVAFMHQLSGASGSKDVSVFVYVDGILYAQNHFDDAFHTN